MLSAGKKRTLQKNCKVEITKDRILKKLPIVILEKLVIKTENDVTNIDEVKKSKDRTNFTDIKQKCANNDVTFRRLRSKVVSCKKKLKETKTYPCADNDGQNKKAMDNLLLNKDENKKLFPLVLLERIPIEHMKKILDAKKNSNVPDKLHHPITDNSLIIKTNSIRKSQKTKRTNLKKLRKDTLSSPVSDGKESCTDERTNINKRNLANITTYQQMPIKNEDIPEKQLSENEKICTKQKIISESMNNVIINTKDFVSDLISSKIVDENDQNNKNFIENEESKEIITEQKSSNESTDNKHIDTAIPIEINGNMNEDEIVDVMSVDTVEDHNFIQKEAEANLTTNYQINEQNSVNTNNENEAMDVDDVENIIPENCLIDESKKNKNEDNIDSICNKEDLSTEIEVDKNGDCIEIAQNDEPNSNSALLATNNETITNINSVSKNSFTDTAIIDVTQNNVLYTNEVSKEIKNSTSSSVNNKNIDSSDNSVSDKNSSDDRDDDEYTSNSESILEFLPDEKNEYKNDNYSQKINKTSATKINYSNSASEVANINHPVHQKNSLFINLKDAYEKISADIKNLSASISMHEEYPENYDEEVSYLKEVPAPLQISDNSDDEAAVVYNDDVMIEQNSMDSMADNPILSLVEQTLHVEDEDPLTNTYSSNQYKNQTNYHPDYLIQYNARPSVPISTNKFKRCPKCGKNYSEINFPRHWECCRVDPCVPCSYCTYKFKHKRSLITHLNRFHNDKVTNADAERIANEVYARAQTLLETRTEEIYLPDFVRVYCRLCFMMYETLPVNYRRLCDRCSKILTFHCNRCHKYHPTSFRVAMHLRFECVPGPLPEYGCTDCLYVSGRPLMVQQRQELAPLPLPPPPSTLPVATVQPVMVICERCNKTFTNSKALMKHRRFCGHEANLRCKFCSFKTRHRSAIMTHMQRHVYRNDEPIVREDEVQVIESTSTKAGSEPVDKTKIALHESSIREMIEINCPKCGNKPGPSPSGKYYVCSSCRVSHQFVCKTCGMNSSSHLDIVNHVARQHAAKIFVCGQCNKSYGLESDYREHQDRCKRRYKYQCRQCTFHSYDYFRLRQHLKRKHPSAEDYQFACERCSTRFALQTSLRQHQKICGVAPGLACAHCIFRTKSKYSLIRHLQSIHAVELFADMQFSCRFCDKRFINVFVYDNHLEMCKAWAAKNNTPAASSSTETDTLKSCNA